MCVSVGKNNPSEFGHGATYLMRNIIDSGNVNYSSCVVPVGYDPVSVVICRVERTFKMPLRHVKF